MAKQQLSAEQKRLDTDIWIIALVTLGVFLFYATTGKQLMSFVANSITKCRGTIWRSRFGNYNRLYSA